jgi:hypothetical protein
MLQAKARSRNRLLSHRPLHVLLRRTEQTARRARRECRLDYDAVEVLVRKWRLTESDICGKRTTLRTFVPLVPQAPLTMDNAIPLTVVEAKAYYTDGKLPAHLVVLQPVAASSGVGGSSDWPLAYSDDERSETDSGAE